MCMLCKNRITCCFYPQGPLSTLASLLAAPTRVSRCRDPAAPVAKRALPACSSSLSPIQNPTSTPARNRRSALVAERYQDTTALGELDWQTDVAISDGSDFDVLDEDMPVMDGMETPGSASAAAPAATSGHLHKLDREVITSPTSVSTAAAERRVFINNGSGK